MQQWKNTLYTSIYQLNNLKMESRETAKFILDTGKYEIAPNVILASKELTDTEKILLIKIIGLAKNNPNWYCYATQETLGNSLWKSKDTIKKTIATLRKKGYIITESNKQTFNHNNITYPNYEKIFNNTEFKENIELKGTPKKDDFFPKPKQELIDTETEPYWYFQDNNIKSFENFWINRREVINQRRNAGIYADRINEQYQDLFQSYIYNLWNEKIKEGRDISEEDLEDISCTQYYYNEGVWNESTYTEEDIKHFQEIWEIDSLPLLWLTNEEFDNDNIRQVILNKFMIVSKEKWIEGRKELRESNKEIRKEREEVIEKEFKVYINQIKEFKYIDKEEKETVLNKMQELLNIMIKDIKENYLIYKPFREKEIKGYNDYRKLRRDTLKKNYDNEDKEKEKLEKQEKAIESKKEEIKDLQKQKQIN